jgi:acyl-CoA hydrolase
MNFGVYTIGVGLSRRVGCLFSLSFNGVFRYSISIVPRLQSMATNTRNDVHHVVTEYGMANLKGMTTSQRVKTLIGLAHPDPRQALHDEAKRGHLI